MIDVAEVHLWIRRLIVLVAFGINIAECVAN
jgi:hypothetical protein